MSGAEREPAGHNEGIPTDPIAFALYVQERLDRGEGLEDVLQELDELDRSHAELKSRRAPRGR